MSYILYLLKSGRVTSRCVSVAALVLACMMILLNAPHANAQLSMAAVNGTVRDSSGAVIPGASITLTAVETGVQRVASSNAAGTYVFTSLTPGRYTLEATASGFQAEKIAEFVLAASQTGTYDFNLHVGATSEAVTVQAENQQLDVTSANLGTELPTETINDLPTNGRNFTSLLSLTPGVVPVSVAQNSGMGGGGFAAPVAENSTFSFPAVNGQTNRSNFFLTDGLNNFGSLESTYAVPPIIDAIEEVKVVSHTDSAESGAVLGGVVNVVTKSGTNAFHGSAWEYDRNTIFDASPFLTGVAEPSFHQNQFGGAVGGPVWLPKLYNGRDKTFFFVAYQGFHYSTPSNSTYLVPTAYELTPQMINGQNVYDLSTLPSGTPANPIYDPASTVVAPCANGAAGPCYSRQPFPGNLIPASRVNQANIDWLKFVYGSLPAAPGDNYNAAKNTNAIDTTPTRQTNNEFNVRVDQHFGTRNFMWFRYSMINDTVNSSGGVPGLPFHHEVPARNWGGSYVRTFSPSLIMQVQYARTTVADNGATRFTKSIDSIFKEVGFSTNFAGGFAGAGGGDLLPSPGISGYGNFGESVNDTPKATDSHQVAGTVTKILGKHEIHLGAGFISNQFESPLSQISLSFGADSTQDTNPDPAHIVPSGDSLASFLLAVPDGANRRNVHETTRPGGVMSFFGQDSWKFNDKLTINAGLRYDYTFIPPYGTNATIGEQGGIETGDVNFSNGTYVLQKVPPPCSVRGHAPCIPGDGTLPAHVVVDPRGKISHNVPTNWGPRAGLSYRIGSRNVIHAGFGIVYDNWAAVSQMAQNIEGSWPDIGQLIANNLNVPTSASPIPNASEQDPFAASGTGLFPAATPFNQVQWFYDPNIKNAYSEQYNFGVQRQVTPSTAVTANYVGSESHRVVVGGYYNTALTPGPGDPQSRALYNYIGPTFYDRSAGNSSYNALQVQLDKRYSTGLSYQFAYTYSKDIDEGGDGWFGVEGGVPVDPYHPAAFGSRSVAGTDLKHVFTENTVFQVPVGKGQRWSTGNRITDYIVGNWQLNNFFTMRSGLPYTVLFTDSDWANTGNVAWAGYEHANLVGDPRKDVPHSIGLTSYGFNPAAFATPPQYTFGTAGRNSLRSSRFINMDASVFRQFPLWGEGRRFEFRAEAFNLFNHRVPGTPNTDVGGDPKHFGQIGTAYNNPRQMQFGGRLIF